MPSFFAIGDIHGRYDMMNDLLKEWNPDKERLILLGDYIDRGPESFKVLEKAMKLKKEYGAIILGGNHEELLLSFLQNPETEGDFYLSQGGRETLLSFIRTFEDNHYYTLPKVAKEIGRNHSDMIQFIQEMPHYYEQDGYVFVHAGVDFSKRDWKETSDMDFRWIRHEFHHGINHTDKKFVFGHTPTRTLNQDQSDGVWISSCGTKIGLDGGACFGGRLHGFKAGCEVPHTIHSISQ